MKKIKYIILIILGVIVLLSSCSMFPSEVERHLFFDSICWEDDSHILMYTMVRKWVNTTGLTITGSSGYWDWSQGEIWRINVFTGEKELLLRREGDYYTGLSTVVKIDILGDRKLISLDGNAYIMEGESANWQEIPGIYEAEWVNENEIIGIEEETGDIVKYDLVNSEQTFVSNTKFEVRFYNYFNKYNINLYTSLSYKFVIGNSNKEREYNYGDTLITTNNDTIGEFRAISKTYESDSGYIYPRVNIDGKIKFLKFDSNINLIGYYNYYDIGVLPRSDFEYFLKFGESTIEILNKNNESIQTIEFPLDQLD